MGLVPDDTDGLLALARQGDVSAASKLLMRHRPRIRRMVSARIDVRLAARLDPSDVVQEAMVEAARRLPDYVRCPPLPFYPWLRQIAWERLVHLHARHLGAAKRAVNREEAAAEMTLSDHSAFQLADRLIDHGTSPSVGAVREEIRSRVRKALDEMQPHDREVLILWYLEQLAVSEIAVVLGITESGVKSRHRRALERMLPVLYKTRGEP